MKAELAARLAELPRLDRKNALRNATPCKICGNAALFFDVVDYQKCVGFYSFGPSGVVVPYYRCDTCSLLFTNFFDDWQHGDFARFIYNEDYIAVDPEYSGVRPKGTAQLLSQLLSDYRDARILDYGAGGGAFAASMANLGFPNVVSFDPFSNPVKPDGKFDLAVCIEVIEHSTNPVGFIREVMSFLKPESCLLIGESLQPADIDTVRGNWWYVAPRNGHVSMFADRTMVTLAERLGLIFHRGANFPHLFRQPNAGRFTKLAESIGPALECYRLGAPGKWPADGFHGVEGTPGDEFQWTSSDNISWRIAVPSGPPRLLQVLVPFAHQSRTGFAENSTLEIAGRLAVTSVRGSSLFAEGGPIQPGDAEVIVRTPAPRSSGHDSRSIGLAIRVTRQSGDAPSESSGHDLGTPQSTAITRSFVNASPSLGVAGRQVERNMFTVVDSSRGDLGGNIRHGDLSTFIPNLWRYLIDRFAIKSMLDVGCGEGHAVRFFHKQGVFAHGIDGLRANVERAVIPIVLHDLLERPYVMPVDFVWSCEVAEHILPEKLDNYLDTLVNGTVIAMTHAVPGQLGHHHVNCQPSEYWIELLQKRGYELERSQPVYRELAQREGTPNYFAQSGLVFCRY